MDFPKRYKVEYLHQLQDVYQLAHPYSYSLLSLYFLPAVQPLHLGHFYGLYLKDFFLKVRDTQENGVQHGIVFAWKSLLSTNNAKDFFEKKNQNLLQVGTTKLCKYLNAQKVKGTKINKKLLSLYFGNYIESFENHPDFSHYAQAIFRKLWKEGKIHIKKNIAYWSVNLQTTIHPHYISFEPAQGKLYTIKYFIETKNDVLPVTTSVPDLIFGDVALLVHPKDKRYKKLIGKNAIIPIVNRAIPILGDETVDISQHNGIKRVCPCADFESIALAEKHGLAVDHYIFNKDGTYTSYAGEFEGKSRKEFYPNVIRFLEDISNLGVVQEVSEMKPYYVVSHEELFPILIDEIVLDVEEEKEILARDLKNNPAWKPVKDKLLALLPQFSFVLNRQLPRGSHIPLLKVEGEYQLENAHIFFERKDVDALQSCFDYSLVCLIREQYLVGPLTSGKLLTTFAQTSDEIKGFFQGLALHRKKPTKVMEKAMDTFLEMIIHFIDDEKMIEKFEQLIQNSSCLRESPDGLQLVWPSGADTTFIDETFDNNCLISLSPIFMVEYGLKVSPTVFVEEGKMYLFLQDLLLQQVLLKKYLYTELIQYTPLLDKNGHKFSYKSLQVNQLFVLLDEYGPSPIRLALLIQKSIDLNIIHWYDAFLRQIWNGIRYLVLSVDKHRVSFSDARNEFIEKADYLDKWIMCEFYELWNTFEHKKNGDYQQLLDMFPLIQQFIQKKLLGWYLEAKKIYETGTRNMTCFIVFSGVLTLLFPFVPGYVRAILQILGFTFHKFPALPYEQEKPLKGVWAYEVFDIIYTFRLQLGIKKHQKITIFFKADANSLTLFQEHNVALKKILNIEQVRLLKLHEHEPLGYYQETFKGITVGIKVLQATSTIKKPNLNDLENQYAQQLEYFEYLRTIITNMPADLDTAKLQQKKDEMEEVKINLGRLQLAIQKIKIKYK